MCARACSRAGFVCLMVAMALRLHFLELVLSFVLGTMEVVMQFSSVVSRAQARSSILMSANYASLILWMIIVPPLGPDS